MFGGREKLRIAILMVPWQDIWWTEQKWINLNAGYASIQRLEFDPALVGEWLSMLKSRNITCWFYVINIELTMFAKPQQL